MSRYRLPPGAVARIDAAHPTDADLVRLQRATAEKRSEYRVLWIMLITFSVLTLGFGLVISGPLMILLAVHQRRDAARWRDRQQASVGHRVDTELMKHLRNF